MAINATSSPCLRCGIAPGRPHIDGCPLDALLEAVTQRAGVPSPSHSTGGAQATSPAPAATILSR